MRLKVLIVDDEALARLRLRTLLGECTEPAASVEGEADNAAQAMSHAQHHPVDVVLVDIHMPGADGLTLARALQALPDPPPWCLSRPTQSTPCMPLSWRRRTTSPSPCAWPACRLRYKK